LPSAIVEDDLVILIQPARGEAAVGQLRHGPVAALGKELDALLRLFADASGTKPSRCRQQELTRDRTLNPAQHLDQRLALRRPHAVPLLEIVADHSSSLAIAASACQGQDTLGRNRRAEWRMADAVQRWLIGHPNLATALGPVFEEVKCGFHL